MKPGNVMITPAGHVKVLDFGLAKLLEAPGASPSTDSLAATITAATASPGTRAGAILGTLSYMSPEQAQGKAVDARSDVFSLGAVFYEMLAGRRPFQGDSNLLTLTAILRDSPPPLKTLQPGVPLKSSGSFHALSRSGPRTGTHRQPRCATTSPPARLAR